ncbi:MAG: hypothetical protein AB1650_04095 [Candidatus Omnitrophota bacterium]
MFQRLPQRFSLGQSAVELAIFGSIVIFVIGLILKISLNVSHGMNIELRAFRMALRESFLTARGDYSGEFSAGRNSASVIIIEDRLTIDPSDKTGTRDRMPIMAQGAGTMTHTLMMDVDPNDIYDAPVMDLLINGVRFPFSTTQTTTKTFANLNLPDCQGWGFGLHTGACRNIDGTYRFFRKAFRVMDEWNSADDTRFDLNWDGVVDVPDALIFSDDPAYNYRDVFTWQWIPAVPAPDMMVDIDGDWKEERIVSCNLPVSCLVVDSQDGDIDGTVDEGSEARFAVDHPGIRYQKPGLIPDMRAYSFTDDDTMLRIEEGQLYDPASGRFIRNQTRQDHLDIIERVFYLSNDTKKFCADATTPQVWSEAWARNRGLLGMTNPVEACGDCFSTMGGVDHRKLTCMDTTVPAIFVRSLIRDRRRTRWITRTGD